MGKQMDSWLKVGSFNKKDEYYTPAIMVYPIIEYLHEGSTIWCPFDTENSEFVTVFTAAGFNVIHSHLWEGRDFFNYEVSLRSDAYCFPNLGKIILGPKPTI